ncbi:unnamed protein product [Adineta ricciae]|uniref:SAM domain-containing protein n=2 Tax=Adineta ricciae TaxID=249248 RepID=A0A815NU18_ADIRI|nr:unnamed protein product [Adineta ricciae]CAF1442942.1 unnamed protein product [Adineta ricciae]
MDVSSWNTDQVVQWLNQNGLSMYFDDFESNKIDGATLLSEDFTEIEQKELIPCIRDRVIFKKVLRELRNSVNHKKTSIYEDLAMNDLPEEFFDLPPEIKIIHASAPFGSTTDYSGGEIYRCYDGDKINGFWNSMKASPNYLLLKFDQMYQIHGFELTIMGDDVHDPRHIEVYTDSHARNFIESFNVGLYSGTTTISPPFVFKKQNRPITNQLLFKFTTTYYQACIVQICLYGTSQK